MPGGLPLWIRPADGSDPVGVEVDPDATVADLVRAAAAAGAAPAADAVLRLGDQTLDPAQALADAGVCAQATVTVQCAEGPRWSVISSGMQLSPDKSTVTLDIIAGDDMYAAVADAEYTSGGHFKFEFHIDGDLESILVGICSGTVVTQDGQIAARDLDEFAGVGVHSGDTSILFVPASGIHSEVARSGPGAQRGWRISVEVNDPDNTVHFAVEGFPLPPVTRATGGLAGVERPLRIFAVIYPPNQASALQDPSPPSDPPQHVTLLPPGAPR
eukprot:TRINITY_DN2576_c0_g1_i1.p1 TRINITY_DN2576_c0_g1~~TRINITY_DN2576_c0_g1_i1.p1  ORF type:complete len:303 (+),score=59.31 TRINITY_DN2576_c0_g1_i1:94-909(+)